MGLIHLLCFFLEVADKTDPFVPPRDYSCVDELIYIFRRNENYFTDSFYMSAILTITVLHLGIIMVRFLGDH